MPSKPTFPWKIKGIPCYIRIDSFTLNQGPSEPPTFEAEYSCLDLRGKRVNPWLKTQITKEEEDLLLDEIFYFSTQAD